MTQASSKRIHLLFSPNAQDVAKLWAISRVELMACVHIYASVLSPVSNQRQLPEAVIKKMVVLCRAPWLDWRQPQRCHRNNKGEEATRTTIELLQRVITERTRKGERAYGPNRARCVGVHSR